MSDPRDFQKSKVFNAEWDCSFGHNSEFAGKTKGGIRIYVPADPTRTLSLAQCREFADLVIRSDTFRAWRVIDKVTIKNGIVNALGGYTSKTISLPEWARTEFVVIHELCHLAVWYINYPAHGREFTGLLLELVREFMGTASADELEKNYINYGVQYDN